MLGYNGLERLSTVEVFEPETKKWKRVAPISKPRRFIFYMIAFK